MGSSQQDGTGGLRAQIPAWVFTWRNWEDSQLSVGDVMAVLIAYAGENVRLGPKHGGGGPYAAAIVRPLGGESFPDASSVDALVEIVSLAVSGVEVLRDASAHAPILAARLAGEKLEHHDLGEQGKGPLWLITTSEPCRSCLEVLKLFRLFNVIYAVRGATVEKLAQQERGEPPRNWKRFKLVQLPAFQPEAAAVISGWKKRQENRGEADYNPELEGQ